MNENDDKIEIIKRKAVQIFSEEEFDKKIKSGKKLTIKFGADPSRPDLHIGHSVPLRVLKQLQDLGHEIVFVIGDFTAMIGDPSGKSKTRPSLTFEQTRKSAETYLEQATKILDKNKTKIVFNSEWLSKMTFEDVIKLASKYTVERIMERDDFKNRFENNLPLSMHELLYPLMQGYDSVALNADIEIGGTDQTFNLLVGRELQKDYEQESQVVITDLPTDRINEIMNGDIREAHMLFAKELLKMYDDVSEFEEVKNRYLKIAQGGIPQDIPVFEIENEEINICDLLVQVGFAASKGEAKRMIAGNGVKIDSIAQTNIQEIINLEKEKIVQFGKNKFVKVIKK